MQEWDHSFFECTAADKKINTNFFNPWEAHWVNLTHTSILVENIFKAVLKSAALKPFGLIFLIF